MKRIVFALVLIVVASGAGAQNALVNPSFNKQLDAWFRTGASGATDLTAWDGALDAAASNLSGSARVVNNSASSNTTTSVLAQCVPASAGLSYRFGARYFVPASQSGTGRVGIQVWYFDNATCSGLRIGADGDFIDPPAKNAWTTVGRTSTPSPAGTKALLIRLAADKFTGSSYVTHWDDAWIAPLGGCRANNQYLCVNGNRFELELSGRDPRSGKVVEGVVAEQNGIYGYFGFPGLTGDAENAEVFVKVIDGRPVNGRFWVFYSGLTDVEFSLTVRDLEARDTRNYFKPGLVLESVADTAAF